MEYDSMTVAELKDLLRDAGLPVSGKKADLIARLQEAADVPEEPEEVEEMVEEEMDIEEDEFESDDFFEDEWDDFHTARQKPVLDDATKAALETRAAQKKRLHHSEGRNGSATSVFLVQDGKNLEVTIPARERIESTVPL